jgi:endo-1,4-beta-D-glucanase Y
MRQRLLFGLFVSVGLMVAWGCSDRRGVEDAFLEDAWAVYIRNYVHPDGYVLDPRRDGGRVTSEGQGYALLRAVWHRDEDAFRRIAAWTRAHLQRPDGLHSWLWAPEGGGRIVDPNTATDGDMEIAWALLMAAQVFDDAELRARGAEIVRAVRTETALQLRGSVVDTGARNGSTFEEARAGTNEWFPAAGDWAVADRITNLSYFVPYAHPWFHAVDPQGGWDRVIEVGYDLLDRWMADPAHRLPPAFVHLDGRGVPSPLSPESELETQFSFDAIRLYWRVEADCRLRGDPQACSDPLTVSTALAILADSSGIVSSYRMDGGRLTEDQSTTFYAALLPAARRVAPSLADELLQPHLGADALSGVLAARDRYYDHNWVWFGLALDRGWIEGRTPEPPVP